MATRVTAIADAVASSSRTEGGGQVPGKPTFLGRHGPKPHRSTVLSLFPPTFRTAFGACGATRCGRP